MRIVHIDEVKSKPKMYFEFPQPMKIYHTVGELKEHEPNAIVIHSFVDLLQKIKHLNISLEYKKSVVIGMPGGLEMVYDKGLFIKTIDEFIPDTASIDGEITYKLDESGNKIPTDGCFIQLLALVPLPMKVVLFTSAGVNSTGITKWRPTAAVRSQYFMEQDGRRGHTSIEAYQKSLERRLNRTKPNADIYKFMLAFFHPSSTGFLDLNKAAQLTFGTAIKAPDRDKILTSPMFRTAMIQMTKILMPELKAEIRKQFPPEVVVTMLAKAYNIASEENKNVKHILEVFEKVVEVGYEETQITTQNSLPGGLPDLPQIEKASPKEIAPTEVQTLETDLTDIKLEEKELQALREETASLDSFIQLDYEENQ